MTEEEACGAIPIVPPIMASKPCYWEEPQSQPLGRGLTGCGMGAAAYIPYKRYTELIAQQCQQHGVERLCAAQRASYEAGQGRE